MLTEQQRRELDWEKTDGLMPVIVQHAVSGEVLMLGYMNPQALDKTIESGKSADPETSYTAKLYASGTKRIAQKVGEEGVETALAATVNDRFELTNEASDLMYHLLVLLQDQGLDLGEVIDNLKNRH